jgi:hypothetical protein
VWANQNLAGELYARPAELGGVMAWNNRIPATSTISFFQLFFQFQLIWVKFRIPAKLGGKLFLRARALQKQQ